MFSPEPHRSPGKRFLGPPGGETRPARSSSQAGLTLVPGDYLLTARCPSAVDSLSGVGSRHVRDSSATERAGCCCCTDPPKSTMLSEEADTRGRTGRAPSPASSEGALQADSR